MKNALINLKPLQDRKPVLSFLSKIICFSLIGGSGFFINYFISYFFTSGVIGNWWYIHASILGIGISMTSNFTLNKIFTFRDTNFKLSHVLKQYGSYLLFTVIGAGIQLCVIYLFVETGIIYPISLLSGVMIGAISNFILNKKWTFYEKIWS
ncbi:MAG TPA: GtrA family protein [Nitrososphaeraceae archaeon]|nr:GtrA family protein [Nitrososphaeraceae archaeon]